MQLPEFGLEVVLDFEVLECDVVLELVAVQVVVCCVSVYVFASGPCHSHLPPHRC